MSEIILVCKNTHKPLVIDADGLFLITQNAALIKDYKNVVLTPNAMELFRLIGESEDKMAALSQKLGTECVILEKAMNDQIYDLKQLKLSTCPPGGSNRRCGGQGDLLAGALATFLHWSHNLYKPDTSAATMNPQVLACYAASFLVKYSNRLAFEKHGRSMTAQDMISTIPIAFNMFFELNKN